MIHGCQPTVDSQQTSIVLSRCGNDRGMYLNRFVQQGGLKTDEQTYPWTMERKYPYAEEMIQN